MTTRFGHNWLLQAALACLVLGGGLLFLFDLPATLTLGVLLLVAFIALGVFTIATPEYLEGIGAAEAPEAHEEPEGPDGPAGG